MDDRIQLLQLQRPLERVPGEAAIVLALDGWTDAGRAGTMAALLLGQQWPGKELGRFDSDALYDYRDRRPLLWIDRGKLGRPVWPSLTVTQLDPKPDQSVFLVQGPEPDLRWRQLGADLAELARGVGADRYVGLGAVPAPVPHTRATRVITTGNDDRLLDRFGRPHEQLTVPASCQVTLEAALGDAGVTTLGLWARIPHYVAAEYPDGAVALLRLLEEFLEVQVDLTALQDEGDQQRQRLDLAASGSDEILSHIRDLERAYDEYVVDQTGLGPLPSGEEIAAEFERFLRQRGRDGGGH